ncbi:MAG: hypothetical protein WCJ30_21115, partial [Deltaproteobacteria bacterium]
MPRLALSMMVGFAALAASRGAEAQTRPSGAPAEIASVAPAVSSGPPAYDRDADARDGVVLPEGVRSVRVTRGGEVLRSRPDGGGARADHYGVTSMERRHVTMFPDRAEIDYIGKEGVRNRA